MISWSASLHRVFLPEEAPHHVGTLDRPEHHHHVNARHLLPMCDVAAARAASVLQVHHVDEAGFGVNHSEEDVIAHILIRLETIPIHHPQQTVSWSASLHHEVIAVALHKVPILDQLADRPVRHLLHPRRCLHDDEVLLQGDAPVVVTADDPHEKQPVAVEQPFISGTGRILPAGCNLHHVVTLERAPLDPLPYFLAPMRLLLKERHLIPCLPHQGLQPKNPIGIPQLPQRDVVLVEGWAEHLFIHQDQCSYLS